MIDTDQVNGRLALKNVLLSSPMSVTRSFQWIALLALAMLVSFGPAQAATVTSVQSGLWSDPATWSGNSLPVDSDDVVIATGTTITLDLNTPALRSVQLDGTLHGGADTINIIDRFVGAGSFQPDSGAVAFRASGPLTLGTQTVPNYFDLWFGDSTHVSGTRTLARSLIVGHSFTCDLRRTLGAKINGTGSLTVGGDFIYVGDSTDWSGAVILNDQSSAKLTRLQVAPPTGPLFLGPFTFPKITIAKPDTTYIVRFGYTDSNRYVTPATDSLMGDTLYVGSATGLVDTAITVLSGTLDAGRGLISCIGSPRTSGPFIHIATGARYRTARVIIPNSTVPFDSTITPIFACDTNSVFEYYTTTNVHYLQDISFLTNALADHAYADLWVGGNTVVGFTYDPVRLKGSLFIQMNGLVNPAVTNGPMRAQQITISGDVLNANTGESNSQGAGPDGDGMTAGNDNWIFDSPHDTSHWSGPSELSQLTVGPTTTLSVRYVDTKHCDSLFVADSLNEELPPCGGHVIGRLYTAVRLLDSLNSSSNFGGIGMTLSTGTVPYLGHVRVMRTAGYLPPGVFYGNRVSHTIKRYFNVIPEFGPQAGLPDTIGFGVQCSEFNGADVASLNFWRSTDGGNAWSLRGISGRSSRAPNTFLLDTNAIGYPNGSNAFLWALTDQEADQPLSVGLESFTAAITDVGVSLHWHTYAEANSLGFEVQRMSMTDTSWIASWQQCDSLRSLSRYGAYYDYLDEHPDPGPTRYRLFERNADGALLTLADATLTGNRASTGPSLRVLTNPISGSTTIPIELTGYGGGPIHIQVFDITGKAVAAFDIIDPFPTQRQTLTLPTGLKGLFFIRAGIAGATVVSSVVLD